MEALAHGHGETAILTAPGGTHAMCLASVESDHHAMRLSYDRWRTAPMHLGASGKVLLAHLDDAHAERILADPPPHPAGGAADPRGDAARADRGDAPRRLPRHRRRARRRARPPSPRRCSTRAGARSPASASPGRRRASGRRSTRSCPRSSRRRGRDRAPDRRAVTAEPVALRAPAGAPLPADGRARRPHAHARDRRGDRATATPASGSRPRPGRATPPRARRSRPSSRPGRPSTA